MYDDTHRAFVQAFFARRILTFDEAKPILDAIITASGNEPPEITPRLFQTYLTTANTALSPLDFHIRALPSQTPPADPTTPRTTYYILTNTTSDTFLQLATTHTAEEIAFFRRLLDAIFETNNTTHLQLCAVRSIEAIRLHKPRPEDLPLPLDASQPQQTQTSQGLTMKEAEASLKSFVAEGWLDLSKAGYYTLSPRALAELHRYLIDTYNAPDGGADEDGAAVVGERIKSCHGCKELVTVGLRCDNLTCPISLHDGCAEGFFRANRSRMCPACGGEWSGQKFVGERAARGVKARVAATGSGRRRGGRPSVASQLGVGESSMVDDEEEEEEE